MHEERNVVVRDSSAGPNIVALTMGAIAVAAVLIALFYWHPWNTTSTTNTTNTTISQPANGQQKSDSTTNTNTQPQPQST